MAHLNNAHFLFTSTAKARNERKTEKRRPNAVSAVIPFSLHASSRCRVSLCVSFKKIINPHRWGMSIKGAIRNGKEMEWRASGAEEFQQITLDGGKKGIIMMLMIKCSDIKQITCYLLMWRSCASLRFAVLMANNLHLRCSTRAWSEEIPRILYGSFERELKGEMGLWWRMAVIWWVSARVTHIALLCLGSWVSFHSLCPGSRFISSFFDRNLSYGRL